MVIRKKTDNAHLEEKLRLRRYFLNKYHADQDSISVFETCQGSGHIWGAMGREYPVRVWGVDVKRKRGRLAVDASRVLASGIGQPDVVDIDTYGEPWGMLELLLARNVAPITVFCTWGMPRISATSNLAKAAIGLPPSTPAMLASKISWQCAVDDSLRWILGKSKHSMIEGRLMTIERGAARVRYIGLRLEPQKKTDT